jgi:hypothetical protein
MRCWMKRHCHYWNFLRIEVDASNVISKKETMDDVYYNALASQFLKKLGRTIVFSMILRDISSNRDDACDWNPRALESCAVLSPFTTPYLYLYYVDKCLLHVSIILDVSSMRCVWAFRQRQYTHTRLIYTSLALTRQARDEREREEFMRMRASGFCV